MKKIANKIILSIVLCSVVISGLMCGISVYKSKSTLLNEAETKMKLLAETQSIELDRKMTLAESLAENLSFNIKSLIKNKNLKGNEKYLEQLQKQMGPIVKMSAEQGQGNSDAFVMFAPELSNKNKAYQSVWVKNNQGKFEDAGEVTPGDKLNPDDPAFDWYYKPMKAKKGTWGDPYVDKFLKKKFVTYTTPIYLDNKFIGVVGMDIDFSVFEKIVNKVKIYKTGNAFLLDGNEKFIIHRSLVDKSIAVIQKSGEKNIKQTIKSNSNGIIETEVDSINKLLSFSKLSNGYIFCVTAPKSEIFKEINSMTYMLFFLVLLGLIIAVIVGTIWGKIIVRPIEILIGVMKQVETGDLTCRVDKISNDEIGTLSKSFNNMILGQRDIITKVIESSNNAMNRMDDLLSAAERITISSNDVAGSSQAIASRSNCQAEDVVKNSDQLDIFSEEINAIFTKIHDVEVETQSIDNMAKYSDKELEHLVASIVEVYKFFTEVKNNITGLNEDITEVSKITAIINGIAEQTNLLALNASIEAARAGESGKGFSIVAQEIGKLADQTQKSSTSINTLLNRVTNGVGDVVSKTDAVGTQLQEQQKIIKVSSDSFQRIISAVDEILPRIKSISESTQSVSSKQEEIVSRNHSLAASTQEISASTEEVAALTEELDSVSKNIAAIANLLNGDSKGMHKQVEQFKI